jgi:hypothetical protein
MGRRSLPNDLLRNIELLVGVALPLFLVLVWVQDHVTGSGHWTRPLESGFFEWLALVPMLVLLSLLHSVGLTVVSALWPAAVSRGTVLLGSVLLVPLLVLAGEPVDVLVRYSVPLAVALVVYGLASRVPGAVRSPEDVPEVPLQPEDQVVVAQQAALDVGVRQAEVMPEPIQREIAPPVRESLR